jgi:PKD repeat protein
MDGGRIKRISQTSGTVMAESALSNLDNASSLMSCSDSIVVLSNRAGKYMGFSYDLQSLKWSTNMSGGNYYAMPNLSKQGIMVMAGAGTTLYAYKNNLQKAPIASFSASRYSIGAGDSIAFSDQSSYQPTSLEWEFEGGTPASSSQQSPVVAYNQEGNYRVRLKAQNALGADTLLKECYITVGPSTNIRTDFVSSDDFYFYPNPAGESFFMGGKSSLAGQKIVLFSAQGKVVFEGVAQQFPYRISLSGLPSGIYQVFYGNEPIPAGKIIKLN